MYEPYVIQRVSQCTWFVSASFYNALVHVGANGVTLIDPLAGDATNQLLEAVRSLTDLQLTGIVYSYYHLDHVESVNRIFTEGFALPGEVALIATDLAAARIAKLGTKIRHAHRRSPDMTAACAMATSLCFCARRKRTGAVSTTLWCCYRKRVQCSSPI